MTEIEKLYEKAGVEKIKDFKPKLNWNGNNENMFYYPPFTAKKQLELIKWLARKSHITIGLGLPWGQYDDNWWTITQKQVAIGQDRYQFEEALANLVNSIWQSLSEEEKEQIKRILEDE